DYAEGRFGIDTTRGGAGPDDSDVLHGDAGDTAYGGAGDFDYCHVDTAFGIIVDNYEPYPGCNYLVFP
ncbi:MAG: hypothetical protein ACRDLO_12145, partial [Solirubrobacterales bacterium]